MTQNLQTALSDLIKAVQGITLGSVETVVLRDSGISLIQNWNDHNEDKIDEAEEVMDWETRFTYANPSPSQLV